MPDPVRVLVAPRLTAFRSTGSPDARHHGRVPLIAQEFPERLVGAVPEAGAVVEEHLSDQEGQLLLHLLVADVRRFVLAAYERGDEELTGRVLYAAAVGAKVTWRLESGPAAESA